MLEEERNPESDGASASSPTLATTFANEGSRPYRFPLEFLDGMHLADGPEWLIKGLVPAQGLLVLYGVSGSGKSFVALDLALHIAAGRRWAGRRVRQTGVIYVASEAGRGMRKRVLAAIEHHGFPRSLPVALVTVAPDLGQRDGDARRLVDDIRAQLPLGFSPGLIILDTLARSMVGCDESGSTGMGLFIQGAEALGRELGALVMPIHHAGKDLDRGMRGSSALLGASDAVWQVAPDGSRRIRVEKMKEEADGIELSFSLDQVRIGVDRDGDAITTCIVEMGEVGSARTPAVAPDPQGRPPSDGGIAFGRALIAVLERHGRPVPRFRSIPRDAKAVRQADLDGFSEIEVRAATPKSRSSQIDRHVRDLLEQGIIQRHGGYIWLADADALTTSAEKPVD